MNGNVIDAATRFSDRGERQKTTPLDALRRTARVAPADRAALASRLGELAARLNPDRPKNAARFWFESAWQGDRWAKRKRYVTLPGEAVPDPRDEGAYVASGADWATLAEQAAAALNPGAGPIVEADRARTIRDLLRGTAFVPAIAPLPVDGDNGAALIATYADRVSRVIDRGSSVRRLWSVLRTAPFGTHVHTSEEADGVDHALNEAALAADTIDPKDRHSLAMGWRKRFTTEPALVTTDWSEPTIVLGLRAHARETRMFVVPQDFAIELPPHEDAEEDPDSSDRVLEWLIHKGWAQGRSFEDLPEIQYSSGIGAGWKPFRYEILQLVMLTARAKPDGSPGLWVDAMASDLAHYHPVLPTFDAARGEIGNGWAWSFIGQTVTNGVDHSYWSSYDYVSWPTSSEQYMPNGTMPLGASSGLVESSREELPDASGWLDDFDNSELQELLFGGPEGVRFIPEVVVARDIPIPINPATVAGAILGNLSAPEEDRISERLIAKARARATAGLAYHDAVVAHHRKLIEQLLPD